MEEKSDDFLTNASHCTPSATAHFSASSLKYTHMNGIVIEVILQHNYQWTGIFDHSTRVLFFLHYIRRYMYSVTLISLTLLLFFFSWNDNVIFFCLEKKCICVCSPVREASGEEWLDHNDDDDDEEEERFSKVGTVTLEHFWQLRIISSIWSQLVTPDVNYVLYVDYIYDVAFEIFWCLGGEKKS